MKILNRLTIKNLKLNKRRTIVTIIGIILATALITGISTLVISAKETLINYQKMTIGNYHYEFMDIQKDEIKKIESNINIDELSITQEVGYINLENEYNKFFKPYGFIMEFSSEAIENLNIKLIEGRLPKNENEIVIQQQMVSIGKIDWNIGDEILLEIGERTLNGEILKQSDTYSINRTSDDGNKEEIKIEYTKKYKVVGIIEKVSSSIEPVTAPGYTIISHMDNIKDEHNLNVYVRYKNLNGNQSELEKYKYTENETLVNLESGKIEENMKAIWGGAIILIIIIILTSVYCIRNSFDISIEEKVKQYGMLSSVGATKKQIKYSIYFEGFILGLIAIPLGIILGIVSIFLILKITGGVYKDTLLGVEFVFSADAFSIILSIILNNLVIYLSARKSASKASKISPIEAIRSNQDIKIKSKKMKSPKFIKNIFGIGGEIAYKSLKRNGQKYKTTLISIIISVSVFIAISSFVQHSFKSMDYYYSLKNYNIIVTSMGNYDSLKEIAKDSNVKECSIIRQGNIFIEEDLPAYQIFSVGEQEYNKFIKELGLSYEETKDKLIWLVGEDENCKYSKGDIVNVRTELDGKLYSLEIIEVTSKAKPLGMYIDAIYNNTIIVSDEFYDKYKIDANDEKYIMMHINAEDANKMEERIKLNFMNQIGNVINEEENLRIRKGQTTLISIFCYVLIVVTALIGITNLFNTITTNMKLRQREFANLKSVGMTKKEFNKMIRLESLFYGIKSLLIAIPLGVGVSYFVVTKCLNTEYSLPINAILISIIAILILVSSIMKISLKKINKQNIIETIRKENI